jgi:hypothetical protein
MSREIDRLKCKARKLYRRMMRELDTVDCGISMLSFIRPSFGRLVAEYDATIARLREIDPSFPKEKSR